MRNRRQYGLRSAVATTALAIALAPLVGTSCVANAQEFRSFDFPGATSTQVSEINSSGEILGRYYDAEGSPHRFVLSDGHFWSIDVPGATFTESNSMNAEADIVGNYNLSIDHHGFQSSEGYFTTAEDADLSDTVGTEISCSGDIVGAGVGSDGNAFGFQLTNGRFSPTDFLGLSIVYQETTPLEVGPIVGACVDNIGGHDYVLIGTAFRAVNCPGAIGGIYPNSIDRFDRMTGEMATSEGHQHGLFISEGKCIAVDFPGSTSTYVNGIDKKGDIVGRYTDSDGNTHGFVAEHFVR